MNTIFRGMLFGLLLSFVGVVGADYRDRYGGNLVSLANLDLKNAVMVSPADTLQAKYDWLKSSDRDGAMGAVSASAPRYLVRTPGPYTGNLSLDTKYVYLVDMDGVTDSGVITYTTAWYGTGSGNGSTEALSILIDSPEAFNAMGDTAADVAKCFRQTADIDFNGGRIHNVVRASGEFAGVYNGNNYTLKNGYITSARNYNGLFCDCTTAATLKNIICDNISITGGSPTLLQSYCAILAGECGAIVDNCIFIDCNVVHVQTQTDQQCYVGMVVGAEHKNITNCHVIRGTVKADVTAVKVTTQRYLYIGGIVGLQTSPSAGVIGYTENCTCSATIGDVNGGSVDMAYIGGICGSNSYADGNLNEINDCTFTGVISYTTQYLAGIGGIVGNAAGTVNRCRANCNILCDGAGSSTNRFKVGGIAGMTTATNVITDCHFVDGVIVLTSLYGTTVGGIVGEHLGDIISSYAICDITSNSTGTGTSYIGGMVGWMWPASTLDKSYCDCNLSSVSTSYIGGAVGYCGYSGSGGTVTDCYVNGTIYDLTAAATALTFSAFGGFVGLGNTSKFANCFTTLGPWTKTSGIAEGFIGSNTSCTVCGCFWDSDTSGITDTNDPALAKTTAQLMDADTFSACHVTGATGTDASPSVITLGGTYLTDAGIVDDELIGAAVYLSDDPNCTTGWYIIADNDESDDTITLAVNASSGGAMSALVVDIGYDTILPSRKWKHIAGYDYPKLSWE